MWAFHKIREIKLFAKLTCFTVTSNYWICDHPPQKSTEVGWHMFLVYWTIQSSHSSHL